MIEIKTTNLTVNGDYGFGIVISRVGREAEVRKCQIVADCTSSHEFADTLLTFITQVEAQFPKELAAVLEAWSKGANNIVPGTTRVEKIKREP